MAVHKSSRTSDRLAPFAIISSLRFSAANRDSACDGVVVFGTCFDSDPAGRTTLAALLNCVPWSGLRARFRGVHHILTLGFRVATVRLTIPLEANACH